MAENCCLKAGDESQKTERGLNLAIVGKSLDYNTNTSWVKIEYLEYKNQGGNTYQNRNFGIIVLVPIVIYVDSLYVF